MPDFEHEHAAPVVVVGGASGATTGPATATTPTTTTTTTTTNTTTMRVCSSGSGSVELLTWWRSSALPLAADIARRVHKMQNRSAFSLRLSLSISYLGRRFSPGESCAPPRLAPSFSWRLICDFLARSDRRPRNRFLAPAARERERERERERKREIGIEFNPLHSVHSALLFLAVLCERGESKSEPERRQAKAAENRQRRMGEIDGGRRKHNGHTSKTVDRPDQ